MRLKHKVRICPKCGKTYCEEPALSKKDNRTSICPDCGMKEALEAAGLYYKEKDDGIV